MRDNFGQCLEWLLDHEGGFVDHPNDPGGATNLGVTRAVYEAWIGRRVSVDDMRALQRADVEPIYRAQYWDRVRADDLPAGIDWLVFDWAVNSGISTPAKAVQRSANARADGAIGPKTVLAIHGADIPSLMLDLYDARADFYRRLSTFRTFGAGWMRRNRETYLQAQRLHYSGTGGVNGRHDHSI